MINSKWIIATIITIMVFGLASQALATVDDSYTISGLKFNDLNNNGVNDSEPILEDWEIYIDGPSNFYDSIVTDNNGFYSFTVSEAGTYIVCELEKPGWLQTRPNTYYGCYVIELNDQFDETTVYDFGNYYEGVSVLGCTNPEALNYDPNATEDDESCELPAPEPEDGSYAISGLKFDDLNNNGINDSEPGIAGWTINITDEGSFSDSVITDNNGNYSFTGLEGGTYTICEESQTDWTQTYPVGNSCYTVELIEPVQHSDSCLLLDKTGRTIFDFSGKQLRSDQVETVAYSDPILASILSGTYNISYASYDNHSAKTGQNQPNEQWQLILKNNLDQEIATTSSTVDLGDNRDWIIGVLETDFVVSEDVVSIIAYHSYYPDPNPNSIYPKCVAFDTVSDFNGYDFGNYYTPPLPPPPPPPPVEKPGCMNSTALNYNPEATIEDNSCTFSGGSTPQPNLKIDKTVDKDSADAGDIVTYTVLIENIGWGKASSIVLWDDLLEGFTYVDENLEGKWEIGDLLKKEERTISFEVLVSEDIEAGLYANIAKITSTNYKTISDDAEVEVHVPEVKGEEIIIAIEPDPEPIIKVLPNTGTSSFAWFILGGLGMLLVGVLGLISIFTKRYRQLIQLSLFSILIVGSLIALVYPFMPVIKYNLSIPFVEADTSIIGMDEKVITEAEKMDGDWLVIPNIGVKIPIVLGQDDSALEKGAWLLPDGSTPDLGGNTALAAHRYKYRPPHEETFYLLDKVSPGDVMYVYWKGEKYEYTMTYSKVVEPEAIEVLDQTEESIITLITCEPLFSSKNRLIVVGELNK